MLNNGSIEIFIWKLLCLMQTYELNVNDSMKGLMDML